MKKTPFLFNYLSRIFSPRRIMAGKNQFNIWQLLFSLFLLVALLMVPITLQIGKMTTFNLSLIMPEPYNLSLKDSLNSVSNGTFKNGRLHADDVTTKTEQTLAAVDTTNQLPIVQGDDGPTLKGVKTAVVFQGKAVTIISNDLYRFSLPYTKDTSTADFRTAASFEKWVNQQWFKSNQSVIVPTLLLMAFIALLLTQLLTWLAVSFFISLVKRSKLSDIRSGKEVFAISTMLMGAPAIFTTLISLFTFNIMLFMTVLSFGLIAMVLAVFSITHFRIPKK